MRLAEVSGAVVPGELAHESLRRPAGRPEAAGPRLACAQAATQCRPEAQGSCPGGAGLEFWGVGHGGGALM